MIWPLAFVVTPGPNLTLPKVVVVATATAIAVPPE